MGITCHASTLRKSQWWKNSNGFGNREIGRIQVLKSRKSKIDQQNRERIRISICLEVTEVFVVHGHWDGFTSGAVTSWQHTRTRWTWFRATWNGDGKPGKRCNDLQSSIGFQVQHHRTSTSINAHRFHWETWSTIAQPLLLGSASLDLRS